MYKRNKQGHKTVPCETPVRTENLPAQNMHSPDSFQSFQGKIFHILLSFKGHLKFQIAFSEWMLLKNKANDNF